MSQIPSHWTAVPNKDNAYILRPPGCKVWAELEVFKFRWGLPDMWVVALSLPYMTIAGCTPAPELTLNEQEREQRGERVRAQHALLVADGSPPPFVEAEAWLKQMGLSVCRATGVQVL